MISEESDEILSFISFFFLFKIKFNRNLKKLDTKKKCFKLSTQQRIHRKMIQEFFFNQIGMKIIELETKKKIQQNMIISKTNECQSK